jgi:hypothetical protein
VGVANALMGVQRALVADVRAQVLRGSTSPQARRRRRLARQARVRAAGGLADDATRPRSSAGRGASDERDPGRWGRQEAEG